MTYKYKVPKTQTYWGLHAAPTEKIFFCRRLARYSGRNCHTFIFISDFYCLVVAYTRKKYLFLYIRLYLSIYLSIYLYIYIYSMTIKAHCDRTSCTRR